jgi:hypothetical protein
MLKYMGKGEWAFYTNNGLMTKAKIWYYPDLPKGHSLHKVGIIGGFTCEEDADIEITKELFDKLFKELRAMGAKSVIGPMDGNTWQNYRLTTYYGDKPTFTMEPYTPEHYIKHWENVGFKPSEIYSSYITDICSWNDSRVDKLHDKFNHLNFRELKKEDLGDIFDLSLKSFTRNPYYVPISKEVYLNKYEGLLSLLKPNLSCVVYNGSELVGYLFAMLDMNDNKRVILKTVAINEERKYAGLGTYLLAKLVEKVKPIGVEYAIHALMYDKNQVQNIVKDNSELLRKYTLYKREL